MGLKKDALLGAFWTHPKKWPRILWDGPRVFLTEAFTLLSRLKNGFGSYRETLSKQESAMSYERYNDSNNEYKVDFWPKLES